MVKNPSISLFFPAYNEEENIESAVNQADAVLREITDRYEIIIVDDGSTDRTRDIAERLKRGNGRVAVVRHEKNLGYGDALMSGIRASRYDWIFFTDSDLQFKLDEIKRFLEYVPEYEAVIGYRSPRRDPFMRLVNAKGWNILIRLLLGLKVRDVDCAFKLFSRKVIHDLPIVAHGAVVSAEILVRLSAKGVRWKELPVSHYPRLRGSATGAKPRVIIRAFKELLKLYFYLNKSEE